MRRQPGPGRETVLPACDDRDATMVDPCRSAFDLHECVLLPGGAVAGLMDDVGSGKGSGSLLAGDTQCDLGAEVAAGVDIGCVSVEGRCHVGDRRERVEVDVDSLHRGTGGSVGLGYDDGYGIADPADDVLTQDGLVCDEEPVGACAGEVGRGEHGHDPRDGPTRLYVDPADRCVRQRGSDQPDPQHPCCRVVGRETMSTLQFGGGVDAHRPAYLREQLHAILVTAHVRSAPSCGLCHHSRLWKYRRARLYAPCMPRPTGFAWKRRKHGDVVITHHGRSATVLRGRKAAKFLAEVDSVDDQALMARLTGNYKRGNESS